MRKLVLTLVAVAALAIPAAGLAEEGATSEAAPVPTASEACKAQLGTLGLATFRLTYGVNLTKANAFGKCVSRLRLGVAGAARNAAQECKAEQNDPNFAASHEGKTFAQVYGGNEKARNALGTCVSQKARALVEEKVDEVVNAAKTCKAERAAGAQAFRDTYGTGPRKANAFGKCVSKTVQQAATTA